MVKTPHSHIKTLPRIKKFSLNNEVIILTESGWLSYKDGLLRTHFNCPLDYCLQTKNFISPLRPDVQCANNRDGVLCGGCLANYSVVLGSVLSAQTHPVITLSS